jgi:hypothetical protein
MGNELHVAADLRGIARLTQELRLTQGDCENWLEPLKTSPFVASAVDGTLSLSVATAHDGESLIRYCADQWHRCRNRSTRTLKWSLLSRQYFVLYYCTICEVSIRPKGIILE